MKRGLLLERPARDTFKEENQNQVDLEVKESGLVLSRYPPFLGASPDALVACSCCKARLLEIKCPRSLQVFSKAQLCGGKYLKPSSRHYTQVQVQMEVTEMKSCILFVNCSKTEYLQVPVLFDHFFLDIVERCRLFYNSYFLPSIRSF